MGEKLTIYWEFGQNGLMYFNGGNSISFQEAARRACQGNYSEIVDEWTGPIPVDIWMNIKDKKKDLTRFVERG